MLIPTPDEVERVTAFMSARPPWTGWVKREEQEPSPDVEGSEASLMLEKIHRPGKPRPHPRPKP